MAYAFCIPAKRLKRRFSYRGSDGRNSNPGPPILSLAGQNDALLKDRFAKSFIGTDASVRLGVEPK